MSIWNLLKELLAAASRHEDIGERAAQLTSSNYSSNLTPSNERADEIALYITGHSAGAAFAETITGGIHLDPDVSFLANNLRCVCSFGPPMCVDDLLAKNLHKQFGHKLQWFRFQNDIVTALPGRTVGKFAHFGQRYISSSAEGVWVQGAEPARQAITNIASNAIGALAWVKNNTPWLRNVTPPFSWDDHSPVNYWETSLRSYPYDFMIA